MPFIYRHSYRLALFKVVCIVQCQTLLRMLLQLKLRKISFWKRKKTNQHRYLLSSSIKDEQQVFSSFGKVKLIGNVVEKKRNIAIRANRFKRDITGKKTSGENSLLRWKQNVSRCWPIMGKKSPQKYWHITNPKLQHFFVMMWKMMDIVVSRKCWILVQRLWKCLNSLLESIYF